MKKYKALFLDVDGTLVDHNWITEENRRAIFKALQRGIKITIASGRGDFMVLPMAHDLYLDCFGDSYSIALNGTQIIKNADCSIWDEFENVKDGSLEEWKNGSGRSLRELDACSWIKGPVADAPRKPMPEKLHGCQELFHATLSDEVTAYLIELGNRNRIHFHVYEGSTVYFMVPENPRYTRFAKYDAQVRCMAVDEPKLSCREKACAQKEAQPQPQAVAERVYDNYRIPSGAQKIIFIHPDHELLEACAREAAVFEKEIRYEFSTWNSLEFTPAAAGKGAGLVKVANALGIAVEDTVAMGDGENDLTMLQAAGLAVVPANALDTVKQQADVILEKTCAESAVAEAIERFFL